jgi:hypothetical protein
MEIPELVSAAQELLQKRLDRPMGLTYLKTVGTSFKSIVLRCQVADPANELPETVVVKHTLDVPAAGRNEAVYNLLADWAALEFLGNVQGGYPRPPVFLGGDQAARLLVMEDLGDGEFEETDPINGNDPRLAEETLLDAVALIGKLHAATMGRAAEYRSIREGLGPMPPPKELYTEPWSVATGRVSDRTEVDGAIDKYRRICQSIGLSPTPGADEEIEHITRVVEEQPGPCLAFCSGDQQMPEPIFKKNGLPRIYDFDCGGFRHALIEGMPARMTWGCYMRIPKRLIPILDKVYQTELARSWPEAAKDNVFYKAMTEAGARWNIFHVIHRLPDALEKERMRGPSTLRQQALSWLDSFAGLSEEFGYMPALGHTSRDLFARLRQIWPEAGDLAFYPAFQGGEKRSDDLGKKRPQLPL